MVINKSNIKEEQHIDKEKQRESNFELLRIISILMIIAHHYCVHGNWINREYGISFNNFLLDFFIIGGKIGVSIFILISGYFGVRSKFKIKKLIKLVLQVLFYSILFGVINVVINGWIGIKEFIKMCFPTIFSEYWFITCYCILYILSPYINKMLLNLKKIELKKLIVMLVFMAYIIPTFFQTSMGLTNLFVLIFLYILGGYISLYFKDIKINNSGKIFVASFIFIMITQVVLEYIISKNNSMIEYLNYFAELNSLPILICATSLFALFINLKIKNNYINILSSATLGVYLIHENKFVRPFLWQYLFNANSFYNSIYLILHILGSILATYVICVTIELFRIYIIERNILPMIYKIYDKCIEEVKKMKIYERWKII